MAATYKALGTTSKSLTSQDLTINLPSGVSNGDLIILHVYVDIYSVSGVTYPQDPGNGWTRIDYPYAYYTWQPSVSAYYCFYDSGNPPTTTYPASKLTFPAVIHTTAWTGVNISCPIGGHNNQIYSYDSTPPAPNYISYRSGATVLMQSIYNYCNSSSTAYLSSTFDATHYSGSTSEVTSNYVSTGTYPYGISTALAYSHVTNSGTIPYDKSRPTFSDLGSYDEAMVLIIELLESDSACPPKSSTGSGGVKIFGHGQSQPYPFNPTGGVKFISNDIPGPSESTYPRYYKTHDAYTYDTEGSGLLFTKIPMPVVLEPAVIVPSKISVKTVKHSKKLVGNHTTILTFFLKSLSYYDSGFVYYLRTTTGDYDLRINLSAGVSKITVGLPNGSYVQFTPVPGSTLSLNTWYCVGYLSSGDGSITPVKLYIGESPTTMTELTATNSYQNSLVLPPYANFSQLGAKDPSSYGWGDADVNIGYVASVDNHLSLDEIKTIVEKGPLTLHNYGGQVFRMLIANRRDFVTNTPAITGVYEFGGGGGG
jgi:hypothetical protein